MGSALLFLGILVFAANFFALIFSKQKIPDVLFLIMIGILLGPIFHIVSPQSFGSVGTAFTTITLVFILFDGGIGIKFDDLKKSYKPILSLTLISVFLSIIITIIVGYCFHLSLLNSTIIGCILSGTAASVVIPLTQHLSIGSSTKTTLILESAVSDVICLILSLALIDAARLNTSLDFGKITGNILSSFAFAIVFGVLGGIIWGSFLKRMRRFKNSMFLTPASVFIIYGVTDILNFSGAIAALTFGITIANLDDLPKKLARKFRISNNLSLNDKEKDFISEIGFFLKTVFFVYIGLSIPFNNLHAMLIGLVITAFLLVQRIFVAKHFSPKDSNIFDKSVISFIIPKGLASAVLASIPEQYHLIGGTEIKDITFAVVLASMLFCSLMIILIEKHRGTNIFFRWFFSVGKTHFSMPKKLTEKINQFKNNNTFFDEDQDDVQQEITQDQSQDNSKTDE